MYKISNLMRSTRAALLKGIVVTAFVGAALAANPQTQELSIANAASVDCMDTESALKHWQPIREQAPTSEAPPDELALSLLSCLGSPNPELRDRIGYELFTYWLRGEKLGDEIRRMLLVELSSMMAVSPEALPGDSAFSRSFSALILSEVMRSDANQPFMTAAERQSLLDQAIRSLEEENDYRGLDAELGWVHPVAHMSDLLWRFALHAETTAEQAESILAGVRSKVAPTGVFYGFNESDRLARVITTIIQRELIDADRVALWIKSFEAPNSMEKWSGAFMSPQGMAELHNTKLFLRALADQLDGADIDAVITESLEALVQRFTQLI
jgi:hypothetical protein